MNTYPFISFIIPALNEEKDILSTLAPLRSLNYPAKEIIVADGGSKDKTVMLAKTIADKVYQRTDLNKSIAENRNNGAKLAKGQFLFFIDCGVKIEKLEEFVKQCLTLFSNNQNLVGLTLKMKFFPKEEKFWDKFFLKIINQTINLSNQMAVGAAMGWVQVVRVEAFWKIGGYNENLITTEDTDLFRRLNKIGRTRSLNNFVVYGSARGYHRDGWFKVIWRWLINSLWYIFRRKSFSKKW